MNSFRVTQTLKRKITLFVEHVYSALKNIFYSIKIISMESGIKSYQTNNYFKNYSHLILLGPVFSGHTV